MMRRPILFLALALSANTVRSQEPQILAGSRESAKALQEARQLQLSKQYAFAQQQYREFLQRYPADPATGLAYHGLGTCQLELDQLDAAVQSLQQALRHLNPGQDDSARWNLALALGKRGEQEKNPEDIAKAAETFEKLSRQLKGSADRRSKAFQLWGDMLVLQAKFSEKNNKWQEAGKQYNDFLNNFPDHPQAEAAQLALLDVYLHTGNTDQFQRWLQKLESKGSAQVQEIALFRGGEILAREKKYAEAAEHWDTLLKKYPFSKLRGAAERQRATILSQLPGREGEALSMLRTWIAQHPTDPLVPSTEARAVTLALKIGDHQQALELALELRSKAPDKATRVQACEWGAKSAVHLQIWQQAFDLYQEILKLEPERWTKPDTQLAVARSLRGLHRESEALGIYSELLKNPFTQINDMDRILCEAVVTAQRADKRVDPIEEGWLRTLGERYPHSPWTAEAYLQAGYQIARKGLYPKALQWAQTALSTQSRAHQAHGLYLAGYAAFKMDHYQDAANYFQLLLQHHRQYEYSPEAKLMFALCLQADQRPQDAQMAFNEFLQVHGQHPLAAKAREYMHYIPR